MSIKTVHEIAKIAGVSPRTIHFYDEIGLLKPSKLTTAGYRLYDDNDLEVLQQILLFKVLGVSLREIKNIMLNPDIDTKRVVQCQKRLLILKRNQLDKLIEQLDDFEEGKGKMSLRDLDINETEWELMWNEIYKYQGEVQSDVLPTVLTAIELFKRENVKKVLDLGCGKGRHSIFLAQEGFEVTATDISEKGIEVTLHKAKKLGLEIATACHDMRDIPFSNDTFDAVLCTWVTGHGNYDDMKRQAYEMLRVLKMGGILFVDYQSKADQHYGKGIKIEKDTFLNNMEGEEKIPHHYSDLEELQEIYRGQALAIQPYTYTYTDDIGNKENIEALVVICKKAKDIS